MKHLHVFAIIPIIILTLLIEPCNADSTPLESIVLGVAENAGDIPPLIAAEQGFFRAEGLDIRYKAWPAGKQAIEAMFLNEVDVATVADTPIVLQSFQRRDFSIIATFSHNTPYRLVARRDSGIRSSADLRGHRIGVMAGTTPQFFLYSLLVDFDIAPTEIIELNVPAAESSEALAQGRVDAIAAFDPHGYYAQIALGDQAIVIPYEKIRHEETFNYVVRCDFLQKHPIAVQKLLRATLRAIDWMRSHRSEAIAIVARRLKMDEAVMETLWNNYRHFLSLDQALLLSLESQARWAIRNGIGGGTTVPNYLDFLDMSPLEAVTPAAITIIR